jgi:hypothetical protein
VIVFVNAAYSGNGQQLENNSNAWAKVDVISGAKTISSIRVFRKTVPTTTSTQWQEITFNTIS